MTDTQPVVMRPKIVWWGKRAGGFYLASKPKGANYEWGWIVKLKKWGSGRQNSGPSGRKMRWYQGRFGQKLKTTHKTATPQQSLALVKK